MAEKFKAEERILSKVFDLRYRIPDYQRPYLWESEQVENLLSDTMEACDEKHTSQYFLGAVVLKKISENEFEVLDGQQRMTTLFLMLAVIRDISDDDKLKEKCHKAVFQEEDDFDERAACLRIEFDIRNDVKDFIDKYIKAVGSTQKQDEIKNISKGNTGKDVSVRNMAAAIITIQKFLQEHSNELSSYFKFLWNKVVLICISTEEIDDAFQIFTVLNNRGLQLRNSDILKVINLREIKKPEDRKRYAQKWQAMEKYFGEDFDQFLKHVFAILVKRKAKTTLLKEFEENIYSSKEPKKKQPLLKKGQNTLEYIDGLFDSYQKIFGEIIYDKQEKYSATNYLRLMSFGLHADYWKAAALLFHQKHKGKSFGEFMKLLDKKISADWICGLSAAKRIENFCAILKEIEKVINLATLFKSKVFSVNPEELKNIFLCRDANSSKKHGYAKYLLLKLDLLYQGNNAEFKPPSNVSIEHILPQNPQANSQWIKDFSDGEREFWKDKLGNLALITQHKNSSLSNLDFTEKKNAYFERNLESFPNMNHILHTYEHWTPTELKQNHAEVVAKLLQAYK